MHPNTVVTHYENGDTIFSYMCSSCGNWVSNCNYEPWEDDNGTLICIACISRCQEWRRENGLVETF